MEYSSDNQYMEPKEYMEDLNNDVNESIEVEDQHTVATVLQNNDAEHTELVEVEELISETNLKLKYHEAETVVQCESKQIILTQESEKTTLLILGEQKKKLLQLINDQQKLAEELKIENEFSHKKIEQSKDELFSMQERVANNEVIVGKLSEFIRGMKSSYDNLNLKNAYYSKKASDQTKKFDNLQSSSRSKIDQLKMKIEEKNRLLNNDNNALQNENLLYKQQIVQQREKLDQLDQQQKHKEMLEKQITSLKVKQRQLEELLAVKKANEEDLERNILQLKKDEAPLIDISNELEKKKSKLCLLSTNIDDIKEILLENHRINESKEKELEIKMQELCGVEDKMGILFEELKDRQSNINLNSELYEEELNSAKKPLDMLNNHISSLKEENNNLKLEQDLIIRQYTEKLEEKTQLIAMKCSFEEKLMAEQPIKANIQFLDEHIELEKSKVDKYQAKIEELSKDNYVHDLTKNKAYLISSKEYLTDKLENAKAELDTLKTSLSRAHEEQYKSEEDIEKKLKKIENLKKKLLENNKEDIQRPDTPVGILKSTACAKPCPISPKKVQFVGVSSTDSSCLSGQGVRENESELFDKLLENFQKHKQTGGHMKKRKLELE
ncbi:unnamed protein product [Phaedon cochleariae]|uniref:Uncharacterized protein n=1 Tax=Phaedon cochleariae TaxID=80249 RepID=A0A9P0GM78_PHACE|nr:unnamed protein product [Phaedon cochleariae]